MCCRIAPFTLQCLLCSFGSCGSGVSDVSERTALLAVSATGAASVSQKDRNGHVPQFSVSSDSAWDVALASVSQSVREALELPETALSLLALDETAGASRMLASNAFSATSAMVRSSLFRIHAAERCWKWQSHLPRSSDGGCKRVAKERHRALRRFSVLWFSTGPCLSSESTSGRA